MERTPFATDNIDCCGMEPDVPDSPVLAAKRALQEVGLMFYEVGWSLGTSSNYSVVLSRDPLRLLITASGKDKGNLGDDDFVIVDEAGQPVEQGDGRPSAETMLHVELARSRDVGAVLHTHSVWGTILSEDHAANGGFFIEGYEMLKGLAGIQTHEHREWVKVFPNSQDIPSLAHEVRRYLDGDELGRAAHGFLIQKHGLYTWGRDLTEARRHVEIFEFLFEVLGRIR